MPQPIRLAIILAFLAFPLLEIAVLIKAGGSLGFWPVFLIVLLTAFAGTYIVRQRGLSVFGRIFSEVEAGKSGVEPMLDTFLVVTAGILLFLPGLITDALGAILLLPPVRRLMIDAGLSRLLSGAIIHTETYREPMHRPETSRGRQASHEPQTIEVDYERIDEHNSRPKGQPPAKP